jgi:hypothetical protein
MIDGLLDRLLRSRVERLVTAALNRYTHGTDDDPL